MYSEKYHPARLNGLLLRIGAGLGVLTLTLLLMAQTVFAKTTYVITDGRRILLHTTSATDPQTVLGEAGLELGEYDSYVSHKEEGAAAIRIRRGQRVYIDYYGERMEVTSGGETVRQLLNRLNLSWEEGDRISVPLEAGTYDGMELSVARVLCLEQTYTQVLQRQTVHYVAAALPRDTRQVVSEGRDGELLCTALVTYVNGVEAEREVLTQQVTIQPADKIVAVGIGQEREPEKEVRKAPVITDSTITLPTGEVLTYEGTLVSLATAYCDKGLTATGTQARVGAIAVDPEVIPYGTRMFIMSVDGEYVYGIATAEDCGSKEHIYGTRTDLHFDTYAECRQFGARECVIYFLS